MKHNLAAFIHIITDTVSLEPVERPDLTQVRGKLTFTDSSALHIRENYVTETGWIDYSYHWQTNNNQLIHRWDNAHSVDLPTSPDHQHIGLEENVQPSEPMTLEKVLTIIAATLVL